MNRWLQHKVLRAKYRKYALRISAVAHIILLIVCPLFFIHSELQELEDEIQVELISELPRQVVKKKQTPIPKEEPPAPEPPKPEMPVPEEDIPERKKITLQKDVNVVKAEQSPVEIAKIPASAAAAVDIQQPYQNLYSLLLEALTRVMNKPVIQDAAIPVPETPQKGLAKVSEKV